MEAEGRLVVALGHARRALVWITLSGYTSQMKRVSVSVAKNTLSALLQQVRGGATITITDRGVAVARLCPAASLRGVTASALVLAQKGLLVLPDRPPSAAWLDLPWPKAPNKLSGSRALLDERDSGR